MIILQVPTINDKPHDFDRLFDLWEQANGDFLEVVFDFSFCGFLRQNAVAFIGGLARLIQSRGGQVTFRVDTLKQKIATNLAQNGFLAAFGYHSGPWPGNSIPFREDRVQDKDAVVDYLKTKWLGRGWVHISDRLRDAVVGKVWEIYANAFEHGHSDIGVFSCGQYYPEQHELTLTVVDFGIGIPANVRLHFNQDPRARNISASKCLQWAFQRGTTTVSKDHDMSRGVGLDLLKEFIKINQGGLDMFSHEGCARIDYKIDMVANRTAFFEGTLVNITLKCDESFYHFSDETSEGPLF